MRTDIRFAQSRKKRCKYVALVNVRWNDTPSDELIPCASNHEVICIRADGIDTMTPSEQAAFIFGWLSRDRHYSSKQYPVEIKFALYETCGNIVDAIITDTPSESICPEEQNDAPTEVNEQPISVAEKEHNNNVSCFGLLEEPQEENYKPRMSTKSATKAALEHLTIAECSLQDQATLKNVKQAIKDIRAELTVRGK